MRTNPNDPYGKILIVAGADADQLLVAAQAVALHSDMLAGAQATIDSLQPARQAAARRSAALGAHRPDHCAVGLRHRRPVAGRWHRAAERLLPHPARHLFHAERPNAMLQAGLSLQLDSHRPHLQHAGAHQQRVPGLAFR